MINELISTDALEGKELKLNVRLSYPYSEEYEYETRIQNIDLDEEMKLDIVSGNGFLVSASRSIKKDLKDPDGIFSPKFGQKLGDLNPYADRYSCECGYWKSRIHKGTKCPVCNTVCKFVDDNFNYFGWIVLKDKYHIIHPKVYKSLDILFGNSPYNTERKKIKGSKLENIIKYNGDVDQDGFVSDCTFKPDNEPYYGIGMMAFYEKFDEIVEYYLKKNPKKKPYYDDIMTDRHLVFTHSIPVFTTHLRPVDVKDGFMRYEPTNGIYNMINRHVNKVNRDKRKIDQEIKEKDSSLYMIQFKFMELYKEIEKILSGKKGQFRSLISARYNFTTRAVIRQDPTLRIDQVRLPYTSLVICLQQKIINILGRTYNISPDEAYNIWEKAVATKDKRVSDIIDSLIAAEPEGIPIILNRNPTISYGSIMQMFCIGQTDTLTFSIPLQVLKPFGADFDGDSLNVFFIINKAFFERAYLIFNPRNAMYISRNDGKLNSDVLIQRDTLINFNTLLWLGRKNYTPAQIKKIEYLKKKREVTYRF